ncbi:MAG: hypothetical protein AAGF11_50265 [Myxococcota bacterium]
MGESERSLAVDLGQQAELGQIEGSDAAFFVFLCLIQSLAVLEILKIEMNDGFLLARQNGKHVHHSRRRIR